jgi:hypothetical protein
MPSRRGRRRSAGAGRSNKMDLGFPVAQKRERAALTQEHASKEGVTPAGVTVVRISNAEQGFHPDRRPHPAKRRQAVACIKNTAAEGNLSTRRSTSTTTAGVPSTPRRDRDGPVKAEKVHSGSRARNSGHQKPEEDEGSQPAWPMRSRAHGRRRQEPDHPHRSARNGCHRQGPDHLHRHGRSRQARGLRNPDRAHATTIARSPHASPAPLTCAAGMPGSPARQHRHRRAAFRSSARQPAYKVTAEESRSISPAAPFTGVARLSRRCPRGRREVGEREGAGGGMLLGFHPHVTRRRRRGSGG